MMQRDNTGLITDNVIMASKQQEDIHLHSQDQVRIHSLLGEILMVPVLMENTIENIISTVHSE